MLKRSAYTIVELLVVVTIIALLSAAAAVGFQLSRRNNRDTKRISDVTLLGRAVDQYFAANRASYPRSATTPTAASMCADQIGGLDATTFTGNALPKDPDPSGTRTSCTNISEGYIYTNQFGHQANLPSTLQGVAYSLEVGLENGQIASDAQLRAPSQLSGLKGNNNYPDAQYSRYRFVLNGPYCGSSCYK